jgi:hypothetical protein
MSGLGLGLLLCGSALAAAPSAEPTVAIHPLVVLEADPAEAAKLTHLFEAELDEHNVPAAPPACVANFLRDVPTHSCAADDGCLAKLAQACKVPRAVFVTAVPSRSKVVLSGKVVRANGSVERTASSIEVHRKPGAAGDAQVRKGIGALLTDDLKVDSLDLRELVAPPAPAVVAPALTAAPQLVTVTPTPAPRSSVNGLRIAGWTVGGVAILAAAAGAGTWAASAGPHHELAALTDPNGNLVNRDPHTLHLAHTLNVQSQWTEGLFISAGALAVSSVVMLLISRDPPPTAPQVSVGASDKDLSVSVRGGF